MELNPVVSRVLQVQRRVLTAAAESVAFKDSWGSDWRHIELERACSPKGDFGFSPVELFTLDDFRGLEPNELFVLGFGNWDSDGLILIPLYLVPFIKGDEQVIDIFGKSESLKNANLDTRGGCIAYGFMHEGLQK